MNYNVTAKPVNSPISLERRFPRPVTPIAEALRPQPDGQREAPSSPVYRGELLEAVTDRRYRPEFNQDISPANRHAIRSYQATLAEAPIVGQILDGFI